MEKKTIITVRESDKEIYLIDMTDLYNEPAGYNKKVQGFKKVAEYIKNNMSKLEQMTMYQVIRELDTIKDLSFHTYCRVD